MITIVLFSSSQSLSYCTQVTAADVEQHRFELCWSTYTHIFLSKYMQCLTICHWLDLQIPNHGYRGPSVQLEPPQVLVSEAGPGTSPSQIPSED